MTLRVASIAFCLLSAVLVPAQAAQAGAASTANPSWTLEQVIPCSVVDAWRLAGKSEERFLDMVQALASVSAEKRDVTLPESKEAGDRFGQMIKKMAKADPDQLLYVIVDRAVQQVGKKPAK